MPSRKCSNDEPSPKHRGLFQHYRPGADISAITRLASPAKADGRSKTTGQTESLHSTHAWTAKSIPDKAEPNKHQWKRQQHAHGQSAPEKSELRVRFAK
jgi:hypothetical protein